VQCCPRVGSTYGSSWVGLFKIFVNDGGLDRVKTKLIFCLLDIILHIQTCPLSATTNSQRFICHLLSAESLLTYNYDMGTGRCPSCSSKSTGSRFRISVGGTRKASCLTDPVAAVNSSNLHQSLERPLVKVGWTRPPDDSIWWPCPSPGPS